MKEAMRLADKVRNRKDLYVNDVGSLHIDKLKEGTVVILTFWSNNYYTVVVDDEWTRNLVLKVGNKPAEKLQEHFRAKGSLKIVYSDGMTLLSPIGTDSEKTDTVIVYHETSDEEITSICFDAEAYYGGLSSKKLSGKKF